MSLMKATKKQLIEMIEDYQNRLLSIQRSAGGLRKEIFDLNLDPEVRRQVIRKIDKHIDNL
tara:strand:- start:780 stop:962 length:183 start_codon:yes stop_codon:yes gene_type:complete